MSIWSKIAELLSNVTIEAFSTVVEAVRTTFSGDPETRRRVAFSIAIIALSAKMAKADGVVTQNEVEAFRQIFHVPQREMENVSRLYNLAKQDVAGFDLYAKRIGALFPEQDEILKDVMDGLFHIAKADGVLHENEMAMMDHIAEIFTLEKRAYERIKLRHLEPESGDPYVLLQADRDWDDNQLKKHFRQLVLKNHPDTLIAKGVPEEFLVIANGRLAEFNKAWALVKLERGL